MVCGELVVYNVGSRCMDGEELTLGSGCIVPAIFNVIGSRLIEKLEQDLQVQTQRLSYMRGGTT